MDVGWGHVCGGLAIDIVSVALLTVRQRGDCERHAACGGVFRSNECGGGFYTQESQTRVDGFRNLPGQTFLVFGVKSPTGYFFGGSRNGSPVDDPLTLRRDFLKDEPDGHEFVLDASAEDFRDLVEGNGDLVKAGDIVFVVLYGVERDGKR